MNNNPAGGQKAANKGQPDKPDKEAADLRESKSDSPPATPPDNGAGAEPSMQESSADHYSFEDFKKEAAQSDAARSAERPGSLNELNRAMRDYGGGGGNHIYIIRNGGIDINSAAEFNGNLVGGDEITRSAKSFVSGSDIGISGKLYNSEIDKVSRVYVETDAYHRAGKILSEKHLLILCGDADMGKRSAAVRLLNSFHKEAIFEIAPTLDDLTAFHCQKEQGYLWHTPSAEKISKLSRYVLDQISNRHKALGSHLVITMTKGARLAPDATGDYLLEWNDCPAGAEVLSRHLTWRLEKASDQVRAEANALREQEDIRELLNGEPLRPSQAGRLAELLAQVARGEMSLKELTAVFANLDHRDVQAWFELHPQRHQRLQMVALAVLHGSNFQRIIGASKSLRAYLTAEESPGAGAQSVETESHLDTQQWLSEFEARIVIREIRAEYGRSTVESVIFKKTQFRTAVLAYVWQKLQHWRTPLLEWLFELGSSDVLDHRIAAAVALSEFSQRHAFDDVLRETVSVWAKSGEPGQRRLAAFILTLQSQNDNLSHQALGVLHHWATMRGNWRLQWTAAAAYGSELGLAYPELAVRDLYEVFRSRHPALQVSVLVSLRYLFECGRQQPLLFTVVMRALESWSRDEHLMKQHVLYIFWELLGSKVDVEDHSWPTILRLAVEDKTGTYKHLFYALFSVALIDKEICSLLLKDLQAWLELADANNKMSELLGWTLYALFKSPDARLHRACRIIGDNLNKWEAADQSRSAGKFLAALKKHFPEHFPI